MAKILGVKCGECYTCQYADKRDGDGKCIDFLGAEELYNAGYRKIPENAVVLTREEHIQMLKDLAESNAKTYETAYKRAVKETAERFAERLKQPPYKDFTEEWVADEICKELTEV